MGRLFSMCISCLMIVEIFCPIFNWVVLLLNFMFVYFFYSSLLLTVCKHVPTLCLLSSFFLNSIFTKQFVILMNYETFAVDIDLWRKSLLYLRSSRFLLCCIPGISHFTHRILVYFEFLRIVIRNES